MNNSQYGMTLLELLMAVMMLVTFTSVVVFVMEFTFRFLRDADKGTNGVLIDHAEARLSMDQLVEVLSQAYITKKDIENIDGECSSEPHATWKGEENKDLLIPEILPPAGYQFCLITTSISESGWEVFKDYFEDPSTKPEPEPGIYMLQALPDGEPNASRLPVRRLFCRPRPFC